MAEILITKRQFELIKENQLINEAWYNTAMDILGIFDPTGLVDLVNGISYFAQGDTLFGILSMVSVIPYAGDVVAKPVMGALKIGSKSTKALEGALKVATTASKGSKEYATAIKTIEELTKEVGPIGNFLRSGGGPNGWATKMIRLVDNLPGGVFKGFKNTIKDYFILLERAATKSKVVGQLGTKFLASAKKGTVSPKTVENLINFSKNAKVFDVAALTKPGFLSQTIFGGIPRLFRSPEGRRLRILMQSTKWWLGFLDYIGVGNFVGAEEIVKKMGDNKFMEKIDEYQKTPQAKKYFDEEFKEGTETNKSLGDTVKSQVSSDNVQNDPFAKMLRNIFMGSINPIPGI